MDRPFAFFTLYFRSQLKVEFPFFSSLYYMLKHETNFFCSLSKQGVATCCVHGPWQEQHSWWVSLRSLQTPSYWPETGKSNAGKINSSNHNMYIMWRPSFTIFLFWRIPFFCNFQARRRNEIRELNNSSSSDGEHADKRRHPKKPKFGQKTPNASSSAAAATTAKEGKLNLIHTYTI